MIIITLPGYLNKISKISDNTARWCYMGKDFSKRKAIADTLKSERFYFKGRIYKIADRKRRPYLDFMAGLGKGQKDRLNWWASKFASKSPFHTDFFLLACYGTLIRELIEEKAAFQSEKLIIFIEDPWLFKAIKESTHNENIRFIGDPNLLLSKFFCLASGVVRRFLLLGWFILVKLLTLYYHRGDKPQMAGGAKNRAGIINPADVRAFKDGQYVNAYMPGLHSFYEKEKIQCFYIYPFPFAVSTAKYFGRNRKILWPLILEVRLADVIKRTLGQWRPYFEGEKEIAFDGCRVRYLLERERWLTFSKAGFNFYLLQFDAFNRFFKKKWCSHVVYLFENQPWEKMLCMAAAKNNVKALGYQHSSFCRLYVSHFIGKDEKEFVPLPYKIITVGDHFAQLFKEEGMPEDKIVVGGTWRYKHLLGEIKDKGSSEKRIILVSLPLDSSILRSMLENFLRTFHRDLLNGKTEIWLKPHPVTAPSDLAILNKLSGSCRVMHQPFTELLNDVDMVIASTSTSGLEAFLYGKKVISYLPENVIVPDPLLDVADKRVYKWHEGETFDTAFLGDLQPDPEGIKDLRKRYFSEIGEKVWSDLLRSEN